MYVNRPYIKLRKKERKKDLMFSDNDKIVYEYEHHYIDIDSSISKDSIIKKFKKRKFPNTYNGKYIIATDYIRKYGGFYEKFSVRKGIISNEMYCDLVLNEADLSDEVVRKLILLELVI